MHVNRTRVLGQKVDRKRTHRVQPRGFVPRNGRDPTLNVLIERVQIIARKKYHHEEHEGHKVRSDSETLRDLRVFRGRQMLPQVTGADGLTGQVLRPQLSFGVWLGSWEQSSRGPLAPAEGRRPPRLPPSPHFSQLSQHIDMAVHYRIPFSVK